MVYPGSEWEIIFHISLTPIHSRCNDSKHNFKYDIGGHDYQEMCLTVYNV